jgi:multicomponent Na+:H+ antiporter subunit G
MIDLLVDIVSWALILSGTFFILTGAIGLVRLPDVYTRMHGAGVVDTLGAGLFLAGLMVQGGLTLVTVKLGLIIVFLFFTSPTSSYALANALRSQGVKADADGESEDVGLDDGHGGKLP